MWICEKNENNRMWGCDNLIMQKCQNVKMLKFQNVKISKYQYVKMLKIKKKWEWGKYEVNVASIIQNKLNTCSGIQNDILINWQEFFIV